MNLNKKSRNKLKIVAKKIKSCDIIDKRKKIIFYIGLGDILLLYAETRIYFRHNDTYSKSVTSQNIAIHKRDINTFAGFKQIDSNSKHN